MIVVRRSMFIGHRFYRIDTPLELTYNQIVIEYVEMDIGKYVCKLEVPNETNQ